MNQICSSAFAVIFATLVFLSPASAQQENDRATDTIVQRLDMILKRLESIETRLKELEDQVQASNRWLIDERGLIRDSDGRPIGFWGIDGLPTTSVR